MNTDIHLRVHVAKEGQRIIMKDDLISRQAAIDEAEEMTNAEAIETLRANYPDACYEQLREAVDAAIWALKAHDATGDVINRQAAIDAVSEGCQVWRGIFKRCEEKILSLSSAQPEIIRCKDCKFYSPMNQETKTGICNLTMHQNFGYDWFCAGAERRTCGVDR